MSGFSPSSSHGGGESSPAVQATKTITNAQVRTLVGTPVAIVAAPGASKVIVPLHATLRLAWTADYTNISGTATMYLTVGSGQKTVELAEARGSAVSALLAGGGPDGTDVFLAAVANTGVALAGGVLDGYSGDYDSDVSNLSVNLRLTNSLGELTGGDAANVLTVTLLYYVVSF